MTVLRFGANVPLEVALKFDGGKQVQSRIPGAPDQMMYTLCGDDTVYVPLHVGEQIAKLGVKRMELISICKHQQNNTTRWDVRRVDDTPTPLEAELKASIDQASAQRAQNSTKASPAAKPGPTLVSAPEQPNPTAIATLGQTSLSQLLAGCMTAAIDAAVLASDYAHARGLTISLTEQSIQDLTTTLMIHVQRMAELECRYDIKATAVLARVQNGGTQWRT